jgi:hypothetical protein
MPAYIACRLQPRSARVQTARPALKQLITSSGSDDENPAPVDQKQLSFERDQVLAYLVAPVCKLFSEAVDVFVSRSDVDQLLALARKTMSSGVSGSECWKQAVLILQALDAAQARFGTWVSLIAAVTHFKSRVLSERKKTAGLMRELYSFFAQPVNSCRTFSEGHLAPADSLVISVLLNAPNLTPAAVVNNLLDAGLIQTHTLDIVRELYGSKSTYPSLEEFRQAIENRLEIHPIPTTERGKHEKN